MATSLVISGNPLKWLQSHNLWGVSDLRLLAAEFVRSVLDELEIELSPAEWVNLTLGRFLVNQVHLTRCYALASEAEVLAWIEQAAHISTSRYKSKTLIAGESLYFGMASRRCTIKIYAKGRELLAHELPAGILHRDKLIAYSKNLLRVEVELKSMELQRLGLDRGYQWSTGTAARTFAKKLEGISIPENMPVPATEFLNLAAPLRGTYLAWREGLPTRPLFKSRQAYKNHRDGLLPYGIDIGARPRSIKQGTVIPLWGAARLSDATIPAWAHGTYLYFNPDEAEDDALASTGQGA